jgi:hypothetical protein
MSKIKLQDFVRYGKLFEVYGRLLSSDRQGVMCLYFEYNMTLAEIAKEKNISRQAVLDAIDKSCQKLEEYESVLQVVQKNQTLERELSEIIADKNCPEAVKLKVEKILKDM